MQATQTSAGPRWWDLRAALLLLVALFAIASRLTTTQWTAHLQISYVIAFLGLAAGLALGQSRFRLPALLSFVFTFGVFVIGWQIGLTLGENLSWPERVFGLMQRLSLALVQFTRQQPVQDPLLALVLFGSLFWILSVQAGYALTRHADPWQATLPGGLALLVIHTYDYRPPGSQFITLIWALSIYFIVSLLLLARLNYLRRREQWQTRRVYFSPEVDNDILQATFIATIVLVILAWAAPLTPNVLPPARDMWAILSRPWSSVRSHFGNAFTSLQASFGLVDEMYGEELSLGRGAALTDTEMARIEAPAFPPGNPRYYWQQRAYDEYDGGHWRSTFDLTQTVTPEGFDFVFPNYRARWTGVFTITPKVPIGLLYAPSQAIWVSRPIKATLIKDTEGKADLVSLEAVVSVLTDETYRVQSALSTATVTQLRTAGDNYPQWVKEHYLQLPTVTDRTRALAREIAAPYSNNYDIAEAVTNYLRQNITYVHPLDAGPLDQELVDWFLFDYKKGFCDYYATAEIVLLRSLGIPARMAAGFARGEIEGELLEPGLRPSVTGRETLTYIVRHRDAHAWPQIYFPEYGWVDFEPTVSQAPITRALGTAADGADTDPTPASPAPTSAATLDDETDPATAAGASAKQNSPWLVLLWFAIPLAIIGLGFAGWRARQRMKLPPLPVMLERSMRRLGLTPPATLREWARLAALPPIEKAYQEVNGALNRLGSPPGPADTPTERVTSLKRILPDAASYATRLLAEYHLCAYSAQEGNVDVAEQAGRLIRSLSWRALVNQKVNEVKGEPTPKYPGWRA